MSMSFDLTPAAQSAPPGVGDRGATPSTQGVLTPLTHPGPAEGEGDRPDRFLTSSGVLFKLKPVAPMLLNDAAARIEVPRPPRVRLIPDLGPASVLKEDLEDPTYKAELAVYQRMTADTANGLLLTRGAEVLYLPPNIESVESEEWSQDIQEMSGIVIEPRGKRRYYSYLKHYVLESMEDFFGIVKKISGLGGVTLDIKQAIESASASAEAVPADAPVE